MAAHLKAAGIQRGDRVAVLGHNRPAYLDATIGCLRSGLVPVPLDIHLPAQAVTERLDDADPAMVLTDPDLQHLAAGSRRRVEVMDAAWPPHGGEADPLPAWPQARAMHYTSGTTGRSKGVYSGVFGVEGGRAVAGEEHAIWGFRDDDVHLVCGPLYHSGPHRFALNTLLYGGTVVLLERFDAATALAAIRQCGVTTSFQVPTHLARILALAPRAEDVSSVRWLAHAGAPCPLALKERALEVFPPGSVSEFYGSTEGQFTVISDDEWRARPGSVGRARAGRQLSVVLDNGDPAEVGQVGTVFTSAPEFARFEYWRDPDRTAAAWSGSGFTVGDLGSVDADGYLYLAGRRGDLIISGGVNVYPAEVERVFLTHPGVFEVAVFGAPDAEWGERVCAAVVAAAGTPPQADELLAWVRPQLSAAQTPKHIVVLDELPRTGSGKVRRSELHRSLDFPAGAADAGTV